MRKVSLLSAAAAGAWAGWRVARSTPAELLAPRRRVSGRLTRSQLLDAVRDREVPVAVEKLTALLELGRERGIALLESVLGGRTGHAA